MGYNKPKNVDNIKSGILKSEFSIVFRDRLLKLREVNKVSFDKDGYSFKYMGFDAEIKFVVYQKE